MPKPRMRSPARSLSGTTTMKHKKYRGSRSLCSPALSTASGRLTSLIDQDKNMELLALSPLNGRSVLDDNTNIEEPRCQSWWTKLDENSHDVMEELDDKKMYDADNVIKELDFEVLSQEKNNYTLNLPESSDSESIHSIVLPQRKLFTQKENQPKNNFGQFIDNRDTLAKLHKTNTEGIDKTANVDTRKLFLNAKRSNPLFPAALLELSPNKTAADKTEQNILVEPKHQVRNIFGNRPAIKRKNMFADFIVSESEDEIPDIEPKLFGFQKKLKQRRISPVSKGRNGSPTSSITTDMEMDDWNLLPSSTMVEVQLEDMMAGNTPIKRVRLSKLSEAKEFEAGTKTLLMNTTADKTKQSDKSVASKNKSKSSPEVNTTSNNVVLTKTMIKNASKNEEDANSSIKQVTEDNKSQRKISDILDKAAVQLFEHKTHNDNIKNKSSVVLDKDCQKDEINESRSNKSNTTNKSLKQVQKPSKTIEESVESQQNEQLSADDNVDGNIEHDQEPETNQDESKDEDKFNPEDLEEAIVSHEDENEDENEDIENDQFENEANASKENEQQVNINEENKQQSEDEANEIEDEEGNVNQETENEHNESHKEDLANQSRIVENEVVESDENEANEIEDEEGNVNQETENEHNESHKEDLANQSRVVENEVVESDENEANASDVNKEEANEIKEVEAYESQEINEEAIKSQEVKDDNENDEEDEEKADNENLVHEESTNESQEIDDGEEASDEVESEAEADVSEDEEVEDDQQMEDSDESDKAIASDANLSEQDDDNQTEEMEDDDNQQNVDGSHEKIQIEEQNEIEPSAEEIEGSPNITHDTTGKNRKKEINKSPEVILSVKTNQMNSFIVEDRNTSIRMTKSMTQTLILRPSLTSHRDSTGFSDGTKNSSAEGSGWDSHRTTRKTLRQTFGKDFTPRKSLRALVMEKSAKRQTEHMDRKTDHVDMHSETVKFPQDNSTKLPEDSNRDVEDIVESDHEVSRTARRDALVMQIEKYKQQNLEKNRKMEAALRDSLKVPVGDTLNLFRVPTKPAPRQPKTSQNKAKKQIKSIIPLDELPAEFIEDMKYKPPKRFAPRNVSWITKRLYKFVEKKLEPRYDYKARIRAEKLVETLYNFTRELRRKKVASADAVEVLKHEFARLEIVNTHHEFYEFFQEFMPREVRIKVIPDIINEIPLPRHGLFSNILR